MKTLAAVLMTGWSLLAPSPLDSGLVWDGFANRTPGHELRVPPGWHVYALPGTTIIFSRPLANPVASPGTVRVRHGDVYLRIDQAASQVYAGAERARPARFTSLPPRRGYDCGFGEGHAILFRDHGWHFQAFVRLGPFTGEGEALSILDSLRVTPGRSLR